MVTPKSIRETRRHGERVYVRVELAVTNGRSGALVDVDGELRPDGSVITPNGARWRFS